MTLLPLFYKTRIVLYTPSFHWKAVNKHQENLVISTIKIKRHEKIFCYGSGQENKTKVKRTDWNMNTMKGVNLGY